MNDLEQIEDAVLAIPRKNMPCGIAMSPQTHAILQRRSTAPKPIDYFGTFADVPVIVDPRLSTKSEVFYDEKLWRERCKEQGVYDSLLWPHP